MATRILCAIDFSAPAREAMRVAADLARDKGAALDLVHVEDRPLWTSEPFVHLPGDIRQDVLEAARRELEEWRHEAEQRAGGRVNASVASGVPWNVIVALANADPSIETIVMGTHGRSGISHVLLGSVAERVVRHAPCSVLVVRPRRER
ncbi:MAG TPA: universal stress protein [Kofleriaceae bacterium]|nr:universal stress protein [Kofleriaceae bacterium]